MPNHTAKSLEAALRGMPPDAPIMVRVGDILRPVALVRPQMGSRWGGGQRRGLGCAVRGGDGRSLRLEGERRSPFNFALTDCARIPLLIALSCHFAASESPHASIHPCLARSAVFCSAASPPKHLLIVERR